MEQGGTLQQFTYEKGRVASLQSGDEVYALTYDEKSRVTQVGHSLAGFEYDDLDRVTTYTDPNGVQLYAYDATGNQTKIDIVNGPTFHKTFDAYNRLTSLQVGDMKAEFTYENDLLRGVYIEGGTQQLERVLNYQGNYLQEITGGDFAVNLTWKDLPNGARFVIKCRP